MLSLCSPQELGQGRGQGWSPHLELQDGHPCLNLGTAHRETLRAGSTSWPHKEPACKCAGGRAEGGSLQGC